jgi:hypothetical protein
MDKPTAPGSAAAQRFRAALLQGMVFLTTLEMTPRTPLRV